MTLQVCPLCSLISPLVAALFRHLLHLAAPFALCVHLPFQTLRATLPQGPVGDGLPRLPDHLRGPPVREDHLRHEGQPNRIPLEHHLHDLHHCLLHILQRLLHPAADLHVRRFAIIHRYRFVIEVVLHGIAIGFAGLECLIGAVCIMFFFGEEAQ